MSQSDNHNPMYRIVFQQQGDVFEVYARHVYQGDMYGFIEVEELLFGERSQVVVDPGEEKLKTTFADVKRTFIPMHSVIRIDEVTRQGQSRVMTGETSNVTHLPFSGVPSGTPPKKS